MLDVQTNSLTIAVDLLFSSPFPLRFPNILSLFQWREFQTFEDRRIDDISSRIISRLDSPDSFLQNKEITSIKFRLT